MANHAAARAPVKAGVKKLLALLPGKEYEGQPLPTFEEARLLHDKGKHRMIAVLVLTRMKAVETVVTESKYDAAVSMKSSAVKNSLLALLKLSAQRLGIPTASCRALTATIPVNLDLLSALAPTLVAEANGASGVHPYNAHAMTPAAAAAVDNVDTFFVNPSVGLTRTVDELREALELSRSEAARAVRERNLAEIARNAANMDLRRIQIAKGELQKRLALSELEGRRLKSTIAAVRKELNEHKEARLTAEEALRFYVPQAGSKVEALREREEQLEAAKEELGIVMAARDAAVESSELWQKRCMDAEAKLDTCTCQKHGGKLVMGWTGSPVPDARQGGTVAQAGDDEALSEITSDDVVLEEIRDELEASKLEAATYRRMLEDVQKNVGSQLKTFDRNAELLRSRASKAETPEREKPQVNSTQE